ncbi:hypothetical protein [Kribbella sp. NPDC051718]|uniref:hypothetical protein n=1 Tax=Kribbella sp. NPDC051718 TaxID=3155168 RepID=UPI0034448075
MSERRRTAAWVLLAVALLEAVVTVVAAIASDLSWFELTDLFVVSNAVIGLSLALAGWPIAYYRPRNAIGWSLLVGGCCYASTATGLSLLAWLGEPTVGWRLFATVINGGWAPALALFIPLTLVLFPDGRLLSPRWRWLVVGLAVNAVLWTATGVLDRKGGLSAEVGIPGYPHWTGFVAVDAMARSAAPGCWSASWRRWWRSHCGIGVGRSRYVARCCGCCSRCWSSWRASGWKAWSRRSRWCWACCRCC